MAKAAIDLSKTTTEQLNTDLKKYCELGFSHAIFTVRNDHDMSILEKISSEIIPSVADW